MIRHGIIRLSRRASAAFVAFVAMLAAAIPSSAQGDAQFTQYWAVPAYYNPAATGTVDFIRIRGGARLQWLGIENAPRSFLGSADI